jgi:hypothetical protein
MDTLALLCNLHADGPATLQRLRRAGCESLAALQRLTADALARNLGWNERAAERFLREATLLARRVDGEDAQESNEPEFELESSLVAELDGEDRESETESPEDEEDEEGIEEAECSPGYAPPVERVEAVLGAWRELDRVAPPSAPEDFVIPRPPPVPDLRLTEAGLEGLTAPLAARLAELDVKTLRQLVAAGELALARAVPLGYTRIGRLRFQARKRLAELDVSAPAPAEQAGFRSYTPPPSEPFETAGPFA